MRKQLLTCILLMLSWSSIYAQYEIELTEWTIGLSVPTCIAHDGTDRLFVTEKGGRIRIIENDANLVSIPFLDITDRVRSNGGEQGLLGLAFHPDHENNGYFFVNYTRSDGATVVARFTRDPVNSDMVDRSTEKVLLTIPQPFSNHNGGDMHFGPDGYLYISSGDGGSGGDPQDNGQDGQTLLGKILRIDVDNGDPYAIPADNPFVADPDFMAEIWSYGLRNPWRFSFDRENGDMWIGDVGQGNWEEVDKEPADAPGGLNYGWRCYEGNEVFNAAGCGDPDEYTYPVHVYRNNRFGEGCSVTGGYVYRGQEYPIMFGDYIYTDFCSGKFWALREETDSTYVNVEIGDFQSNQFGALGEDIYGELYAAALSSGVIYKITLPCWLSYDVIVEDQTCPGEADGSVSLDLVDQTGEVHFEWSSGDSTRTVDSLDAGVYYVTVSDGSCSLVDSVEIMESDIERCDLVGFGVKICAGETIELEGCVPPSGHTGQWFLNGMPLMNETNEVIETGVEGRYTYGFTGVCEIEGEGYIDVEVVIVDTPEIIQQDSIVVGPGGYSEYIWMINGEEFNTGSDSTISIMGRDGQYSLVVIDSSDCQSAPSDVINVMSGNSQNYLLGELEVYPNPVDEKLWVNIPDNLPEGSLGIYDSQGKLVYSVAVNASEDNLGVDVESWMNGIYFIRYTSKDGFFTARFVKNE